MKKKCSNWILILIFLLGLGIVLYPSISDQWNRRTQSAVVNNYDQTIEAIDNDQYKEVLEEAHRFNERLYESGLSYEDQKDIEGYEDTLNVDGSKMMGYIEIPKIDVKLPIYHGYSDAVMASAVGHLKGTSLPVGGINTHSVLSSHRGLPSARLFTDLDKLEEGDTFSITVLSEHLTYQIFKIRIVEPQVVRPLDIVPGQDLCTLVTCTPYGINTHRMLLTARRVDNALEHQYRITSDARRRDPLTLAPVIGLLLLLLIWPVFLHRTKPASGESLKRGPKLHRPGGRHTGAGKRCPATGERRVDQASRRI